jgi:trehalose 6-phosphate synthase/phosphatase
MLTTALTQYKKSYKKLLLLDYDGTLVGFASTPEKATPSLRLLDILQRLSRKHSTKVVITTGRASKSIDTLIGHIPIDIIAEHGAMIKEYGQWRELIQPQNSWKKEILQLMDRVTSICKGAWVEEKRFSVSWHYRNADPIIGYVLARRLLRLVKVTLKPDDARILDGNKTIEVLSKAAGKDKAVEYCLNSSSYDYILSIGDDKTDEDMFEALLGKVRQWRG